MSNFALRGVQALCSAFALNVLGQISDGRRLHSIRGRLHRLPEHK